MSHDELRHMVPTPGEDDPDPNDQYGTFHHRNNSYSGQDPETGSGGSPVKSPVSKIAIRRQFWTSLGYGMGALGMGCMLGWSSTSLPELEKVGMVTKEEAGWVGSLICLGALMQGPLTGVLMNKYGRRNTVMMMSIFVAIGWFFIATASDVWMLYLGRIITGFGVGGYSVVIPVYVSEISSPEVRGALGTLFQIMVVFGIFAMYVIGSHTSWSNLAYLSLIIPLGLLCLMPLLKDSPTSYMLRNRPELARKTLIHLRNSAQIEDELYAIQKSVEESRRNRQSLKSIMCSQDPTVRKPFFLTVFLMFNQQLCGINAVILFTVDILHSAGSSLEPKTATMIIGLVQLVATVLSSYVNNHVGRRKVLLVTQAFMNISLISFGAYFYLKTYSPATAESINWLPIVCLILFIVAFSFGLGPLAWLLLGELLPAKTASVAGPFAASVNWTLSLLVTAGFNYLLVWMGDYGAYWLFASLGVWGMYLTWKFLPETKGKTIREIQDGFRL